MTFEAQLIDEDGTVLSETLPSWIDFDQTVPGEPSLVIESSDIGLYLLSQWIRVKATTPSEYFYPKLETSILIEIIPTWDCQRDQILNVEAIDD